MIRSGVLWRCTCVKYRLLQVNTHSQNSSVCLCVSFFHKTYRALNSPDLTNIYFLHHSWCWWFLQVPKPWVAGALVPGGGIPAIFQSPRPPGHTPPWALAVWSRKHSPNSWSGAPALHTSALLVPAVLPGTPHWSAHHEVSTELGELFVDAAFL